jgi:hypothetical protein
MNYGILLANVVLGTILLYSYYYLGSNNSGVVEKLWGRIRGNLRNFYLFSMLVTLIGYLLMLYFLVFRVKNNNELLNEILVFQIIVIVISMLWMPLSIKYLTNKNIYLKPIIILVLFVVGIAALGNTLKVSKLQVSNKNKSFKNLAVAGAGYLFFHTFVLDFLGWNYNFL